MGYLRPNSSRRNCVFDKNIRLLDARVQHKCIMSCCSLYITGTNDGMDGRWFTLYTSTQRHVNGFASIY